MVSTVSEIIGLDCAVDVGADVKGRVVDLERDYALLLEGDVR
jgi:hypothetical protein